MNTTEATSTLPTVYRIKVGQSVDRSTGIVYAANSDRPVGKITERCMRNRGWIV